VDISFKGLIENCAVVYLDDVTMFIEDTKYHVCHLRKSFCTCRRYSISMNPRKSIFVSNKGRLLGFLVSKYGIMIDPKRIEEITNIPYAHSKKYVQSFLGKINFVTRFIPRFVETVKPL
jgi:hypothetical protein